MIAQFKRCRIIVRYGVGTDNIDVDAATDAGIFVGNVVITSYSIHYTKLYELWALR